jgi:hypothetical protein
MIQQWDGIKILFLSCLVIRLITACSIPNKQFLGQKMPLEEHQIDNDQKMRFFDNFCQILR